MNSPLVSHKHLPLPEFIKLWENWIFRKRFLPFLKDPLGWWIRSTVISSDPGPSGPAPRPRRQPVHSTVAPFHSGWVVRPKNWGHQVLWFFSPVALTFHFLSSAIPSQSPQTRWKTSPLVETRESSRTQGHYSKMASNPLWGPKFLCGQMLQSKTTHTFWQCTHQTKTPICKSHVNLLNFSWKRRHCMWWNICRESGCLMCKPEGIWGSWIKRLAEA